MIGSDQQAPMPAGDHPPILVSAVLGLGPLLIVVAICVTLIRRLRWATGRTCYGEEMFIPRTIRLEQEGLVDESAQYSGTFRWDAFLDLMETSKYVFLRLGIGRGHVIPKRCFRSREEMAIFINQFRNRLAAGRGLECRGQGSYSAR